LPRHLFCKPFQAHFIGWRRDSQLLATTDNGCRQAGQGLGDQHDHSPGRRLFEGFQQAVGGIRSHRVRRVNDGNARPAPMAGHGHEWNQVVAHLIHADRLLFLTRFRIGGGDQLHEVRMRRFIPLSVRPGTVDRSPDKPPGQIQRQITAPRARRTYDQQGVRALAGFYALHYWSPDRLQPWQRFIYFLFF